LINAFEQGRVASALIGSNDLKIPDPTWRTHDRVLALRSLIAWANERNAAQQARHGFAAAVDQLLAAGAIPELVDLIWCYVLVAREADEPSLMSPSDLLKALDEGVAAWGSALLPDPAGHVSDATVRAIREELV